MTDTDELAEAVARESHVDADALLTEVHERLGGLGVDFTTYGGSGEVFIRWRRDYDGAESDERQASAGSLTAALQAVLDWEDEADRIDAEEEVAR